MSCISIDDFWLLFCVTLFDVINEFCPKRARNRRKMSKGGHKKRYPHRIRKAFTAKRKAWRKYKKTRNTRRHSLFLNTVIK